MKQHIKNQPVMYPFFHKEAHANLGDKLAVGIYYLEEIFKRVTPSVIISHHTRLQDKFKSNLAWQLAPKEARPLPEDGRGRIPGFQFCNAFGYPEDNYIVQENKNFPQNEINPFTQGIDPYVVHYLSEGRLSFGFDIIAGVSLTTVPVVYIDGIPTITFGHGTVGNYLGNHDWHDTVLAVVCDNVPLLDRHVLSRTLELPYVTARQLNLLKSTMAYINVLKLGGTSSALSMATNYPKSDVDCSTPDKVNEAKEIILHVAAQLQKVKEGDEKNHHFYLAAYNWVSDILLPHINCIVPDAQSNKNVQLIPVKNDIETNVLRSTYKTTPYENAGTIVASEQWVTIDKSAFMPETIALLDRWVLP